MLSGHNSKSVFQLSCFLLAQLSELNVEIFPSCNLLLKKKYSCPSSILVSIVEVPSPGVWPIFAYNCLFFIGFIDNYHRYQKGGTCNFFCITNYNISAKFQRLNSKTQLKKGWRRNLPGLTEIISLWSSCTSPVRQKLHYSTLAHNNNIRHVELLYCPCVPLFVFTSTGGDLCTDYCQNCSDAAILFDRVCSRFFVQ